MTMIELSPGKFMKIMSLHMLRFELVFPPTKEKKAAIILSQDCPCSSILSRLDDYIILDVADTLEKDHPYAFSMEDGARIKNFLMQTEDIGCLYVCCDSGVSRSSATAAAIMRFFGKSDKEIWSNYYYCPNTLIYKRLCRVFKKRACSLRIRYLRYLNQLR